MDRPTDCNKSIRPEKREPEWHYPEEAISQEHLHSRRYKEYLRYEHKRESRNIDSPIIFLSFDPEA